MRIGLYFGSFNPVHQGHLIIASHIINETDIQKIWFVVSPHNPFKESSSLLDEYQRLHLVKEAIKEDDRLAVSDIEFSLPRPSYTAHTLGYLTEKYPSHKFSIVMGSDSYQNIANWKNSDFILANYQLLIYERSGFPVTDNKNAQIIVLKAPLLQISATHIRELIREGKSIRYLVPPAVEEEILAGGYYKKAQKK